MRNPGRWFLLAVCILFNTALTTPKAPELTELSTRAAGVFVGRVVEQKAAWDAPHRLIVTQTHFVVEQWVKGSGGTTQVVTEIGGTVDGTTLENPARAVFQPGQRYLVFLTPRFSGGTRTLWGPYGSARVEGPKGQETITSLGDGGAGRTGQLVPLDGVLQRVKQLGGGQ